MRYFKVLKCPQEKTISRTERIRTPEGAVTSIIQYRQITAGEADENGEKWYPGAYGHHKIKEGDVIALSGHLADKCGANPNFEEVDKPVKKVSKKKAKKKT